MVKQSNGGKNERVSNIFRRLNMFIEIKYKEQGNGSNSWTVKEFETEEKKVLLDAYMVYFLTVQNWKLKAVLNQDGLINSVETALNNLPEPQKTNALFGWNYAPTIDSNSDTTKFIQSVLSLTDTEVIEVFFKAQDFKI